MDEVIENNTEMTNETKKISFIGFTSYKVGQKYDIKKKKKWQSCFLIATLWCPLSLPIDNSASTFSCFQQ